MLLPLCARCAKSSGRVGPSGFPIIYSSGPVTDSVAPSRCPHVRDVCRNRNLHPRHDVVHMKNAEGLCWETTYIVSH